MSRRLAIRATAYECIIVCVCLRVCRTVCVLSAFVFQIFSLSVFRFSTLFIVYLCIKRLLPLPISVFPLSFYLFSIVSPFCLSDFHLILFVTHSALLLSHPQGDKGDRGDRGLTTTIKGDEFPTGIIEGPPGPPGPPGKCTLSAAALQPVFVCPRLDSHLTRAPYIHIYIKQILIQKQMQIQMHVRMQIL